MIPDILDIEARVDRGVRLLDQWNPGWRDQIAPGDLSMVVCDRCVLGQLYGHYFQGGHELGIQPREDRYGFNGAMSILFAVDYEVEDPATLAMLEYELLDAEWLKRIKE